MSAEPCSEGFLKVVIKGNLSQKDEIQATSIPFMPRWRFSSNLLDLGGWGG